MNGSRIPPSYVPASWRCTLPIDPATKETGIGFTQPDGSVIRLRLSVDDARQLVETLSDLLEVYDYDGAQKPKRRFSDLVLAELADIKRELRLRP